MSSHLDIKGLKYTEVQMTATETLWLETVFMVSYHIAKPNVNIEVY
jgi:hypothetical protein